MMPLQARQPSISSSSFNNHGSGFLNANTGGGPQISNNAGGTQNNFFGNQDTCLADLRITDPRDDKKRIEGTKGGLLKDSYCWILRNTDFKQWRNDEQSRLLWIKGDPGKGKTMLLCGIINELGKQICHPLSYFFCQATDSRLNRATAVLRGLIYLLVDREPSLISHVRKRHDHAGKSLFEDVNAWAALSDIFTDILQDPGLKSTFLIIDALDECVTDLPQLLDLIVEKSSESSRVKWIVSSRNWPGIEERLRLASHGTPLSLEVNAASVSAAVELYIREKMRRLVLMKEYNETTRKAVEAHLLENANSTFLWVALVCQNLEGIRGSKTLKSLNTYPPGLDPLYARMMEQILGMADPDDVNISMQILATATTVYRPVALEELEAFADSDDMDSLEEIVGFCGSFLAIQERTVYFVHQSAKEFLSRTASDRLFPHGTGDAHWKLFRGSLKIMTKTLRRDIYDLHYPGTSIDDVRQPEPDPLAPARYSCISWVDHLSDAISHKTPAPIDDLYDDGTVHQFLSRTYLYWLEALSLLRGIPGGGVAMTKLETLLEGSSRSCLFDLVRDARRFILSHGWAIGNAPLQAYAAALIFSPRRSVTRKLFEREQPNWILSMPAIAEDWDACMATLEGHGNGVLSVAFSPDGQRLASASGDRTVKIWDATTGHCQATLEGHRYGVESVAFSPDGQRLASASVDRTVKIWDATTGHCQTTLDIGRSLYTIRFDETVAQLFPDAGTFDLGVGVPSPLPPPTPSTPLPASGPPHHSRQRQAYGISADGVWITYQGQNLLWLPSEYRPLTSEYHLLASVITVAFGYSSGRVLLFRFSEEALG